MNKKEAISFFFDINFHKNSLYSVSKQDGMSSPI